MCDYASVFKNTIYKKEYFFPKERDLARYRAKFPNGFRIRICDISKIHKSNTARMLDIVLEYALI